MWLQLPIAGRARESDRLMELSQSARHGQGAVVLLGGEAGVGKSRLAQHLLTACTMPAVKGWCPGAVQTPPYTPWLEVVAALCAQADPGRDSLPPPFGRGPEAPSVHALAADLAAWLAEAARCLSPEAPGLLVLLEDLQEADAHSLELLRQLTPRLARMPVLLVATYRTDGLRPPHPLTALLPDLVRGGALRLLLERLDQAAVTILTRTALPGAPDPEGVARHLYERTAGHPLFVVELLAAAVRTGSLPAAGQPLPETVQGAVALRLGSVNPDHVPVLQAAAVVGERFAYALLASVVGSDEAALEGALEEAVALRILRLDGPAGDRFAFDHALLREALLARLIGPRRRRFHQAVGEALLAMVGADPEAVAYHLERAGDPRAADACLQAVDRALQMGALAQAARLGEQALAQLAAGDPRRPELLLKLGFALRVADGDRARTLWEQLLAEGATDPAVVTMTHHMLAWRQYGVKDAGSLAALEQVQHLEAEVAEHPRYRQLQQDLFRKVYPYPPVARIRAAALALGGRLSEAAALIGQMRTWSGGAEDADLDDLEANVAMYAGRIGEGAALYRRGADAALVRRDYRMAFIYKWSQLIAMLWSQADQPDAIDRVAAEVHAFEAAMLDRTGYRWMPEGISPLGYYQYARGDWEGARHNLIGYFTREPDAVDRSWWRWAAAHLCLALGDPDHAALVMAPVRPRTPADDLGFERISVQCHCVRARIAMAKGELAAAADWLNAAALTVAERQLVSPLPEVALCQAELARLRGRPAEALTLAEQALNHAAAQRAHWAAIEAGRLAGRMAAQLSRPDLARGLLTTALDLAERCRLPYERALTQVALAVALPADPNASSGLREAIACLTGLGAAPALAEAEALLAEDGAIRAAPAPALPDGLTEREAEVVRLVAAGCKDREIGQTLFISVKTVQAHLRNIFNKAGVANRAALVAYAARHGLVQ